MRVVHVISNIDLRAGGPALALLGLASAQARAGLDVSVVATWSRGATQEVAQGLRAAGVRVTLVGPATWPLARHPRLPEVVKGAVADADVVHVHALWEEIQHRAARAAQAAGVPYIIRPCGMLDPWSLSQRRLRKRLYLAWRLRKDLDQAAALHFTSDLERDLAAPLKLVPRRIVEPNGVDITEFEPLPEPGAFRRRWPQIADRLIVLFLGRVHPKKGLDLLVRAMARLDRRDVVLVIAGPGEAQDRASLDASIQREKVEDRVIQTGILRGRDRVAALADADLFVLPSYQENFGLAVVEAMAAGTAVIVSDQVNIYRDVLAAGAGGVVKTTVDSIAAELPRWLDDQHLRDLSGRRGAALARERFDWNTIARRWSSHYANLARLPGGKTSDTTATAVLASTTSEPQDATSAGHGCSTPAPAGDGNAVERVAKPIRVLHVISSLDRRAGGTAATVVNLAQAQSALGMTVTVAATWCAGEDLLPADELRRRGVAVELIGPCFKTLAWHRHIAPTIRQQVTSSDVVHVHGVWEEIQHQAAKACRRAAIPYVMLPQGMLDPWSLAQRRMKKAVYLFCRLRRDLNGAAAMHFTTDIECDLVAPLRLAPRIIIEPLGVDLAEFENLPPRGTFRGRFPQLGQRRILLFLSRLHYKKGLDLLLTAFARVRTPDIVLVLAGPVEAAYRAQLEQIIAAQGLEDAVVFTGMLHGAERIAALAEAELFVLPSHQENFGIAVVEALAAGTPVLISNQVNIWRSVVEAGVGAAVATNVDVLAQELARWLRDPALRAAAAARARPFVWANFDWTEIARRWEKHYQRLRGAADRAAVAKPSTHPREQGASL